MPTFWIALLAVAVAVIAWLCARSFDIGRLDAYLRARGGRLLSHRWRPFGKGWIGEGSERIYDLRYRDPFGVEHVATAKTSWLTGVYLTDDRPARVPRHRPQAAPIVAAAAPAGDDIEAIRAENARLRSELARLKSDG